MATTTTHKNVTILYGDGVLSVSDENDDRLILAPSQHVAVVTLDSSRNSYTDNSCCCIVIGFNNGRYKNQSHVFQAKSNREVRMGERERERRGSLLLLEARRGRKREIGGIIYGGFVIPQRGQLVTGEFIALLAVQLWMSR